jgi:hypothetical protein
MATITVAKVKKRVSDVIIGFALLALGSGGTVTGVRAFEAVGEQEAYDTVSG